MRVFISWSGERSKSIAEALRTWLPRVLQSVSPWMSKEDLNAGSRWLNEVSFELNSCNVGVLCVTPENQHSPWLLFEAGALSKTIEESKVCPLLHEITPGQLSGPLTQFQAQTLNKDGILRILGMLNDANDGHKISATDLQEICDVWWPRLEEKLLAIGAAPGPQETRPVQDQLDEILELSREQLRRENIRLEAMQAREQKMDKIFGMMDQSVDMMQGIQEISKRSEKDAQRMLMEMGEAFKTIDPQSPEGAQRMLRALGSSVTSKRKSALDMDINAFRTMRKELSQVDEEQKEFTRQIMNKPPAEDA